MKRLPNDIRMLIETARHKDVEKGQVLLYQGDDVSELLYLASGIVKMYDIDSSGNEKILHIFKTPSFIPLAIFSGENVRTRWFYAALTDCTVVVVPRATYDATVRNDSGTTIYLSQWFSNEVHEILTRLNSLSKTNTQDKLYAALKYLATYYIHVDGSRWQRVIFPVTHQLLADFIGVSRESVTNTLRTFEHDKIVKFTKYSTMHINCKKLFKH